jgi:hypothetical protein
MSTALKMLSGLLGSLGTLLLILGVLSMPATLLADDGGGSAPPQPCQPSTCSDACDYLEKGNCPTPYKDCQKVGGGSCGCPCNDQAPFSTLCQCSDVTD